MAFPQLKKRLSLNSENNDPVEEYSPYEMDEGAGGAALFKSLIGDKAPPSEFEQGGGGITESLSPIDFIQPGMITKPAMALGREIGETAIPAAKAFNASLGRVGSIGMDVQPEMGLADRIRQASQNSNVRFAQPMVQQEERYVADAPKNYWDKIKEKANEKSIGSNPGTKEAFEKQKQATQEALKKRREQQYKDYLDKIKGSN